MSLSPSSYKHTEFKSWFYMEEHSHHCDGNKNPVSQHDDKQNNEFVSH